MWWEDGMGKHENLLFTLDDLDLAEEGTPRNNAGQFRKGHDPRRLKFTWEECSRGGWVTGMRRCILKFQDLTDKEPLKLTKMGLERLRQEQKEQRHASQRRIGHGRCEA
jgi:hypothetical protein